MEMKEALSVTEISKTMGVSRPSVYNLLNRQDHPLPSIRIGRRRVVPRKALMDWMEEETRREVASVGGTMRKPLPTRARRQGWRESIGLTLLPLQILSLWFQRVKQGRSKVCSPVALRTPCRLPSLCCWPAFGVRGSFRRRLRSKERAGR